MQKEAGFEENFEGSPEEDLIGYMILEAVQKNWTEVFDALKKNAYSPKINNKDLEQVLLEHAKDQPIVLNRIKAFFKIKRPPNVIQAAQSEQELQAAVLSPPQVPVLPKYKSRLFLGEGDVSFAAAYLRKHQNKQGLAEQMTVTCFDSQKKIWKKYDAKSLNQNIAFLAKNKIKMHYGVDARTLEDNEQFKDKNFQRIHFNFPHDGRDYHTGTLSLMLKDFFRNAAKLQKIGDRIHMALPCPKRNWDREFREGYAYCLFLVSAHEGYIRIKKRKFDSERYPGYTHKMTSRNASAAAAEAAGEYIFEKTALSYKEICVKSEVYLRDISLKSDKGELIKQSMVCFPKIETSDDSSEGEDDKEDKKDYKRASTKGVLTPRLKGLHMRSR